MTDYIVSSVTVTRGRGGNTHRSFGISTDVDDGTWYPIDGYTLAAWRVRCRTKVEAQGIVLHWLATGKPSIMDVRQVFPKWPPGAHEATSRHGGPPP